MLRFPLIHPPLLAALAACGHGGKVLLTDANYSHSTNVYPSATTIYLNLRRAC
ncbi:MAG: RbsD/FucU domain-containing protein [Trebonia sp.]